MPKPYSNPPAHPPIPPGSLRVWWIPQGQTHTQAEPLRVPVVNLDCAKMILRALAAYEAHCEHSAVVRGGLEVLRDGEWTEWHNADGNDIRWVMADGEEA